MPRVLFVHHRPQPSGAARSLALLIDALDPEWNSHVAVPAGKAAELFASAGATVHRMPVPAFTHTWDVQYSGFRWLVAARELASVPAHRRALRALLSTIQPDVVHLNDSVMIPSAAVAAHAGARIVWHLRSSLANGGADRRSRYILRLIDRYGLAAVAIDNDVARTFPLAMPVHQIPNPVRREDCPPANLGVPAGRFSVGYIGYLRRQKGWPQFLAALQLLVARGVPVHGVVVGGGVRPTESFRGLRGRLLKVLGIPDESGDFARMVRAHDLDRHISWLPFTDDVGPVYRALDLLTFPNQGVGLGRPVMEAAAYGVPVVASGSPDGAGLLLPGTTGVLLASATSVELSKAIEKLATDAAARRRLGAAAADHAARIADPRIVAERVQAVWAGVATSAR